MLKQVMVNSDLIRPGRRAEATAKIEHDGQRMYFFKTRSTGIKVYGR